MPFTVQVTICIPLCWDKVFVCCTKEIESQSAVPQPNFFLETTEVDGLSFLEVHERKPNFVAQRHQYLQEVFAHWVGDNDLTDSDEDESDGQ